MNRRSTSDVPRSPPLSRWLLPAATRLPQYVATPNSRAQIEHVPSRPDLRPLRDKSRSETSAFAPIVALAFASRDTALAVRRDATLSCSARARPPAVPDIRPLRDKVAERLKHLTVHAALPDFTRRDLGAAVVTDLERHGERRLERALPACGEIERRRLDERAHRVALGQLDPDALHGEGESRALLRNEHQRLA